MNLLDWPHRLKSARRKKRLVRKDYDKQLIKLDKHHHQLLYQKRHLPMIRLEHPYQRGWKRLFVLRDDVRESEKGEFYQTLLEKINTVRYHHDKHFKRKKRRRWRYQYEEQQTLHEVSTYEWFHNKLNLTDIEKRCFYPKEECCVSHKTVETKYVFAEAWRFVLVVKTHIVYEVKMVDELLEQELAAIDNYIDNNHLWYKIRRLTNGRSYDRWGNTDKPRYNNKLKNTPMYAYEDAYVE
jgi:hypothetical protein